MAVDEHKHTNEEWKQAKKNLQSNGFYHATHWEKRLGVQAHWMRRYAESDKINAIRVWIGGTPKMYYNEVEAKKVAKAFGL